MTTPAPAKPRLDAPDLLRGLIMVIMLLDHTRDFTHWSSVKFEPTDLTQASAGSFLTRWITHFCAPLFVLLAGMAAAFQQQRGKTARELSAFLVKRGVWLCLVELILIRFLIFWKLLPEVLFLQVFALILITGRDASLFTQYPVEWKWNGNVGFNLYVTYAVWISGAVILYFPCKWFAGIKARRRDWWLSYI